MSFANTTFTKRVDHERERHRTSRAKSEPLFAKNVDPSRNLSGLMTVRMEVLIHEHEQFAVE